LCQYNLLSHPDRLLKDHLLNVRKTALTIFDGLRFVFNEFKKDKLSVTIELAAVLHDFGKSSHWFQEYIQDVNSEDSQSGDNRLKQHSLISSVLCFDILRQIFPSDKIYAAIAFIIIRRHHGNLRNWSDLLTITDDDFRLLKKQIDGFEYLEFRKISEILSFDISNFINKKFLTTAIENLETGDNKLFRFRKQLKIYQSFELYFAIQTLYSVLLFADKNDAIFQSEYQIRETQLPAEKSIIDYKENILSKNKSNLNKIRNSIFIELQKTLEEQNIPQIFSLNTPTGSGKTFLSLYTAVYLRSKFNHSRIIYCLPFTSIIDQNYGFFYNIFKSVIKGEISSSILLKHHHLADFNYTELIDDGSKKFLQKYSTDRSQFLVENWESDFVVTTFIQIFYSLVANKNSILVKFNRFSNAIIILDEIQTIPHKYWLLINKVLKFVSKHLNSTIILVTATMPLIFSEEKKEIFELIPNKRFFFNSLSRIELDVTNISPMDNTEFIEWIDFLNSIEQEISDRKNESILIVMNTIKTAQNIFNFINKKNCDREIKFLSSHILPFQRLSIIDEVKNNLGNSIFVTTQLIEAGVDLDFDFVVRDFAPLDSIFQVCGRCNRNGNKEIKSKVKLFMIKDENGRNPSNIYDKFLLDKTLKVLGNKTLIQEKNFFDLSYEYMQEVKDYHSDQESQDILENMEKQKFDQIFSERQFELITNEFSRSLFIEYNEDAQTLWTEYQQILETDNSFQKKIMVAEMRRKLSQYIINIPKKNMPDGFNDSIYYLSQENVNEYYNPITGFKLDKQLPQKTETGFY
jgi:CRISPR-associated endonuclease/helicase Cas3